MRIFQRISRLPACLLPLILMSFLLLLACVCHPVTAAHQGKDAAIFAGEGKRNERTLFSSVCISRNCHYSPSGLSVIVASILLVAASTIPDHQQGSV